MKINFFKEDLEQVLKTVSSVIPSKTSMDILTNVLIKANQKEVVFYGTDADLAIIRKVHAEVIEAEDICVPAKLFYEMVRSVKSNEIKLSSTNLNEIKVEAGNSEYKIHTSPVEDYPEISISDYDKIIEINGRKFLNMLDKTSFAISTDTARHILNGLFIYIGQNLIEVVATDGRRLAYLTENMPTKDVTFSNVIPKKAINELEKILDDTEEENIEIGLREDNKIIFKVGDIILLTKVIEGVFPDYKQVIPKDYEKKAVINRENFIQILQESSVFIDKTKGIKFILESGKLTLMSKDERGESKSQMEVDYEGETFETGYNITYLLDILKHMEGEEIHFMFKEPLSSALLIDPAFKEGQYLYILMPMRL